MSNDPPRDTPTLPEGYIPAEITPNLLAWSAVEEYLVAAQHYWLSTTRPDGRPHVVPRWGAWLDGRLYYDGSPETVHARNLAANPACALHVGDGVEVVIVEGTSGPSEPIERAAGEPIAAEIARKYGERGYAPEPDAWSGDDAGGMAIFTPTKALAWFDFPSDLTRFKL